MLTLLQHGRFQMQDRHWHQMKKEGPSDRIKREITPTSVSAKIYMKLHSILGVSCAWRAAIRKPEHLTANVFSQILSVMLTVETTQENVINEITT